MKRSHYIIAVLAILSLAVAGCGGADSSSGTATDCAPLTINAIDSSSTITLDGDTALTLNATAATVTIQGGGPLCNLSASLINALVYFTDPVTVDQCAISGSDSIVYLPADMTLTHCTISGPGLSIQPAP